MRKLILVILAATVALSLLIVSCTSKAVLQNGSSNMGEIRIVFKFPEDTKPMIIPPETDYFEVALQRQGDTQFIKKGFFKEDGIFQNASFYVIPGTYKIRACAKTERKSWNNFLAFGTTTITVKPNEVKTATIELYPVYYDFSQTRSQAQSTELINLSFIMKVPSEFVIDFLTASAHLHGELPNAAHELAYFYGTLEGTETIHEVEYGLIRYTSTTFRAPLVDEPKTFTWRAGISLSSNYWLEWDHYSPTQNFIVLPGSGELIVIIQ